MHDLWCPKCCCVDQIESEDLPDRACDSAEHECEACGYVFKFGWFPQVEVRGQTSIQ